MRHHHHIHDHHHHHFFFLLLLLSSAGQCYCRSISLTTRIVSPRDRRCPMVWNGELCSLFHVGYVSFFFHREDESGRTILPANIVQKKSTCAKTSGCQTTGAMVGLHSQTRLLGAEPGFDCVPYMLTSPARSLTCYTAPE